MRVWIVAAEAAPWVKVGGLADMVGGLFGEWRSRSDVRPTLVLPGYRDLLGGAAPSDHEEEPLAWRPAGEVPTGESEATPLLRAELPGGSVLAVADPLFDRPGVYGPPSGGGAYPDHALRYGRFARAAAEASLADPPDVLHVHDAHAALVPAYLSHVLSAPRRPRTVLTIHNLSYPILAEPETARRLGFGPEALAPLSFLEFHGRANFLKAGILTADRLTTVSPTYAREILTPQMGCGLDGVLRDRAEHLVGILNGVDTERWNPRTDPFLPARYHAGDLSGKRACRSSLLHWAGFPDDDAPLLAFIGRFVPQKGVDLWVEALAELAACEVPFRLVALGTGIAELERQVRSFEEERPDLVRAHFGFDEALAHRIEAGADLFLMPSRFEPCGLNQMYSQLYGTLPVVRRTGGLADTVVDLDEDPEDGTGVVFDEPEPAALAAAVRRALECWSDLEVRFAAIRRGMERDFSMRRCSEAYLSLFEQTLAEGGR